LYKKSIQVCILADLYFELWRCVVVTSFAHALNAVQARDMRKKWSVLLNASALVVNKTARKFWFGFKFAMC